jgi:hypothetical protein
MLRSRRLLAFSGRVYNYLLLIYAFFFLLFFSQLWWPVSASFARLLKISMDTMIWTGLGFGIGLLLLALRIWIVDHVFPATAIFGIILRTLLLFIGGVFVQLFSRITSQGVIITF